MQCCVSGSLYDCTIPRSVYSSLCVCGSGCPCMYVCYLVIILFPGVYTLLLNQFNVYVLYYYCMPNLQMYDIKWMNSVCCFY